MLSLCTVNCCKKNRKPLRAKFKKKIVMMTANIYMLRFYRVADTVVSLLKETWYSRFCDFWAFSCTVCTYSFLGSIDHNGHLPDLLTERLDLWLLDFTIRLTSRTASIGNSLTCNDKHTCTGALLSRASLKPTWFFAGYCGSNCSFFPFNFLWFMIAVYFHGQTWSRLRINLILLARHHSCQL